MTSKIKVGFSSATQRYFFAIDGKNIFFFDEIRAIEKIQGGCFLHFLSGKVPLFLDKNEAIQLWARISDFLETDPEGEPCQ